MNRICNFLLGEPDFASDGRMRTQAVTAQIALGDSESELLADLGVENATGERTTEVEIALERRRRIPEHPEEVRHQAELVPHQVEQLAGFAFRFFRVELSDPVHVRWLLRFSLSPQSVATTTHRTHCVPGGY